MKVQVDGDNFIAQQVIAQIQRWDQAVVGQHVSDLVGQCADDIEIFDVSSQLSGLNEYKTEWQKFSPYFSDEMSILRRDAKLYVSEALAILYCHSKVEHKALKGKLEMPWCRTTLCLKKINEQWLVVHQHISMPVDMITGKAVMLKDKLKLRWVV